MSFALDSLSKMMLSAILTWLEHIIVFLVYAFLIIKAVQCLWPLVGRLCTFVDRVLCCCPVRSLPRSRRLLRYAFVIITAVNVTLYWAACQRVPSSSPTSSTTRRVVDTYTPDAHDHPYSRRWGNNAYLDIDLDLDDEFDWFMYLIPQTT